MLKHYRPSWEEMLGGRYVKTNGISIWRAAVPRTPDIFAKCVFYIYMNEDEAKSGDKNSATGFFFGVESEFNSSRIYLYAITNFHVIDQADTPTLRINTRKGGFETYPTKKDDWEQHPLKYDLSIYRFKPNELSNSFYNYGFFDLDLLITEEFVKKWDIGVGDDIFMVGNFQKRGGRKKNIPSTRLGNISQMPDEPMENPHTKLDEESFVVEMRSTSGYSGSPVILSLLEKTRRVYVEERATFHVTRERTGKIQDDYRLLGIDWGHIRTKEYLYNQDDDKLPNSESVWINSAMAGVVPGWRIAEMIFSEEEIEMRRKEYKNWQKEMNQSEIQVDFEKEKEDEFTDIQDGVCVCKGTMYWSRDENGKCDYCGLPRPS